MAGGHSGHTDWIFGEGWVIVPITEIQVRDPVRLIARMARIIAAAEGRRR